MLQQVLRYLSKPINIFLLRHGETDWNQEGRLQGHMDIPLNANGKSQISHAAQILKDLHPDIDLIISSPLSRAYESAEIVAGELAYKKKDILVEPLLTERSFGVGEGLTAAERSEKYPGDLYPGMESFEDLLERARRAFDQIVIASGNKQNILVAAHGAILYAMVTALTDGRIPYGGKAITFDPGSIHFIKYSGETIELAAYNEEVRTFINVPIPPFHQ